METRVEGGHVGNSSVKRSARAPIPALRACAIMQASPAFGPGYGRDQEPNRSCELHPSSNRGERSAESTLAPEVAGAVVSARHARTKDRPNDESLTLQAHV